MPEIGYQRHEDNVGATKEEGKKNEFDTEDGFLAFSLAIHNLLMVGSYVLVLGNTTSLASVTVVGILSVCAHFLLSETLMKGVRKHQRKFILPWTLSVLLEEIMLAYLAISHVSGVVSEYASFGAGFREVGGFFVVNTTISGIRYFLWAKVVLSCWRTQYQKF